MSIGTNTRRQQKNGVAANGERLEDRSSLGWVRRRAPRRTGQWAASVLFIALVVVGLVWLFDAESERVEVLVVGTPVAAGQFVERGDLRSVQVAGVADAVLAADQASVVGRRAATGLVEGQVVTQSALTSRPVPATGERLVALSLTSGRVPGGLAGGDVVDVLAAPVEGAQGSTKELQAPQLLAEAARVQSVGSSPEGGVVVTVLVRAAEAESVAAFSSASRVTILQAPQTPQAPRTAGE